MAGDRPSEEEWPERLGKVGGPGGQVTSHAVRDRPGKAAKGSRLTTACLDHVGGAVPDVDFRFLARDGRPPGPSAPGPKRRRCRHGPGPVSTTGGGVVPRTGSHHTEDEARRGSHGGYVARRSAGQPAGREPPRAGARGRGPRP